MNYDVSLDGEQFLMVQDTGVDETSIVLVQNWFEEPKERVPVN